jgi:hypothetical protein
MKNMTAHATTSAIAKNPHGMNKSNIIDGLVIIIVITGNGFHVFDNTSFTYF